MALSPLSRRRFLISAGAAALAVPLLQACGQPAQPAQPTTAPAATQQTGGAATAAPKPAATQAAATAPKATGARTPLSIAVRAEPVRTWQDDIAKKYAQEKAATIDLKIEQVVYNDMAKKQLAMLATGTMPDVIYSGIKWFHYSAFKGAFLALDDLIKTDDPGMSDLFPAAIEGSKLDGKLYALPHEVNHGNQNVILYNKDMLDAKGLKEPTDDWTLEDYASMAAKLTDKDKKVFGTNFLTSNYYDFAALTRSYGVEILSDDGKKFLFANNPKALEAARWQTELRTKLKAAPLRDESQGIAFPSGQIALLATGNYDILAQRKTVGDKFKWDVVLGPKGPDGLRGYEIFLVMFSIYAKSKYPKEAYDLLKYESSKETAMFAFLEQGQPPARISVWSSPEAQKVSSYWGRASTWLTNGKDKGPFPLPYNLRFQEFQDKWQNMSQPVFYGEVGFDEGVKKIQEECQAIVDLPRG